MVKRLTLEGAIERMNRSARVYNAIKVACVDLGERSGDVIAVACLRIAAEKAMSREGFMAICEIAWAEREAKMAADA